METGPKVCVRLGFERATVYHEGGIGFESYVKGVGWIIEDEPSPAIQRYATAVRKIHYGE